MLSLLAWSSTVAASPPLATHEAALPVTAPRAPDSFLLKFNTDVDGDSTVTLNITRSWAPIGVDHLYALVADKFYDGAAFFIGAGTVNFYFKGKGT